MKITMPSALSVLRFEAVQQHPHVTHGIAERGHVRAQVFKARPTPQGNKYIFLWLATFIVVLVATVSVFRPSLFALCFLIAWFFLSQEIFKRIIPRYNESWEEVFDRLLSDYGSGNSQTQYPPWRTGTGDCQS